MKQRNFVRDLCTALAIMMFGAVGGWWRRLIDEWGHDAGGVPCSQTRRAEPARLRRPR